MARRPVFFQGCFGWIHEPDGGCANGATGVVLASAFGQEEVCTHYGMMALAEELASRGMAALRFDYLGLGDSASAEISLEQMVLDVEAGAALLQQECGAGPVVLAGVRLGSMVALLAAEKLRILAGLVLMAPPVNGSAFLRETRAAAKMNQLSSLDPVPSPDSESPLNTNGFHWSAALQREIATFDATKLLPPKVPVLMMAARGDRRPGKLGTAWRDAGRTVLDRDFTEYEGWMQDPTTSTVPMETFRHIATWVESLQRVERRQQRAAPVCVTPTLNGPGFTESPVQFGPQDNLFGVLCEPDGRDALPVAALLLHEGSSHHIGNGGAYVTQARRFAAMGVASLRMDLTGMGDSPARENPRHPHYDPERIPEALAGLDALEKAGYRMAVVSGLCSGAYTAWQVSLADQRVVGSAVVNLQKFVWHYGDDIRVANRNNKRSARGYMRAMRNRDEWKRVFAGKADVRGTIRVLSKRAAAGLFHQARNLMPLDPKSETAMVHRQMRSLAERRVLTHLVFADDDPGLADVYKQFGRKGKRLAAFLPARLHRMAHADHHFNGSSARQRLFELMENVMRATIDEHAPQPAADSALAETSGKHWMTARTS